MVSGRFCMVQARAIDKFLYSTVNRQSRDNFESYVQLDALYMCTASSESVVSLGTGKKEKGCFLSY